MTDIVKKLAIYLKEKYEKELTMSKYPDCWATNYRLPINQIHDISVFCEIEIQKHFIEFKIEGSNIRNISKDEDNDDESDYDCLFTMIILDKDVDFTLKDYEDFIGKIFNTLEIIELNKMTGQFVIEDKKNFENDIFELLRNFKHINLSYENCSVCDELTETKTACNHYLCIYCWDKIKKSNETGVKPCPICRKAMEYKHEDEDE